VPATSRCGIRARSTTAGPPAAAGERLVGDDLLEEHLLAGLVRHLDADRGLAGDRRDDPDAQRLEREREVVGQVDDLVDPGAGRRRELVHRDHRAGSDRDHVALDPVVLEGLGQLGRQLEHRRLVDLVGGGGVVVEQLDRR
jgi:hypothetical protein